MKLDKAQAHIANEIRRTHENVNTTLERLNRRTVEAIKWLGSGNPDSNHTDALAADVATLAAHTAARTVLVRTGMVAGLSDDFIASIFDGPFQYYMANDDEAETAGEDPDEVELMRQRHTFKCILAGRKAFDENRRDYITSDGQKAADQWMPVIKRDLIVAEWLSDGTKSCECAR